MYKTDLHIHTCLSPCATLDMSPKKIAAAAREQGIDIIGICDHNSCENVPALGKTAAREGVAMIGGIEITSSEEVHILALFADEEKLFAMQEIVYDHLPGVNDAKRFGDQVIVNEFDEVLDFNTKLLIGAVELPIEKIVDKIHELDGLAIASHIDREGFSILDRLGFIPRGLGLDALEISTVDRAGEFADLALPIITASDAHDVGEIGKSVTCFLMEDATVEEIRLSLRGKNGRRVMI